MLRYAITDRTSFQGDAAAQQAALLRQAGQLALDGLDFLQLREKDLGAGSLAGLARQMTAVLRARTRNTKLLINSRADIAVAIRADGVHLTSAPGSLTPAQIRELYAAAGLPAPVVSVSCHTLEEVARARDDAATLILFGPVFEKCVGEQVVTAGTGLELLRAACAAAAPIPVLALGGVTPENTAACVAAGAAGVAAIRLFQRESLAALSTNPI
jgi:thiamine-phosphate pyrophosphorylase